MEGILKRAVEAPPDETAVGVEDPAMAQPETDEPELLPGQEMATPEEQEIFDRAVAVGKKIMAGKGFLDRMLSQIRKSSLGEGVTNSVVPVVEQVDQRMDLPEEVILSFAIELATFAFAAAVRSKLVREGDEAKITEVMQVLMSGLAQIYEFDPAEVQDMLMAMDEAGAGDEGQAAQMGAV